MNYKAITLLFIMAGIHTSSQPMDLFYKSKKEPVITKPYEPSFSTKYPRLANFLLSAAVGGATYLGAQHIKKSDDTNSNPVNPLLAGIATFIGLFTYREVTRKPRVVDSLLTNPREALQSAYKTNEEFVNRLSAVAKTENLDEKFKKGEITAKKIFSVFQKTRLETEKEFPIFLLGECTQEGIGNCLLSRTYKPEYRNSYANKVVTALSSQLKVCNNQLQYTSFGCGGGFQDFVICTKFLAKHPNAELTMHLIDFEHTPHTATRSIAKTTNKIEPHEILDIDQHLDKLVQYSRNNWNPRESDTDIMLKNMIIGTYMEKENRAQQFISYLKKTFPNATLSLHLHTNAKDYLAYLDTHKLAYPDVITAADIQDEMSLLKGSMTNYIKLCIKTLQKKPTCLNLLLAKDGSSSAGIASISLEKSDSMSSTEEFELDSNNTIPVYFTENVLIPLPAWKTFFMNHIFR